MSYSEQELKAFYEKDRRISLAGIIQSMIVSGKFSKEEILEKTALIKLAKEYREMVWEVVSGKEIKESKVRKCGGCQDWDKIAEIVSLPIPTQDEIKILSAIWNEYETVCPERELSNLRPELLLKNILREHSQYPSKQKSIKTVLASVKLSDLMIT